MYEQLELKNEFLEALGNLTLMTFETGDYNKIKDLLLRYGLIECNQKISKNGEDKFVINKEDSLQQLLSYFDEDLCEDQGINHDIFHHIQKQKKMRSRILSQAAKKFCGTVEKEQIFKQCILPKLITVCENLNVNMIDLIHQII